MEERINKMFRGDCILIISFLAFLWVVLIGVMTVVAGIAETPALKTIALGAGAIVGISATTGMVAVISHLKNHKTQLYTEDITCALQMQETE